MGVNPNETSSLMEPILFLLIPLALLLGAGFLVSFMKSAQSGQWDDLDTPPQRLVEPDHQEPKQ